jgi:hypothetical protein
MNILLNRLPPLYAKECIDEVSSWGNVCFATIKGNSLPNIKLNKNIKIYCETSINYEIYDIDSKWVIGNSEISWLQQYEGMYLSMVNKFVLNTNSATSENLLKHFYEQVNFWFNVLQEYKIEQCLSYHSPSDVGSFCLHLAAKYKKIPHIFRDINVVANNYQYLSCSLESRNLLMGFGKTDKKVVSFLHKQLEKVKENDPSAIPFYMDEVYERYGKFKTSDTGRSKKKISLKRRVAKYLLLTRKNAFYRYGDSASLRKLKIVSFVRINIERWYLFFFSEILKIKYNMICSPPPKSKYIFLADSLIPENANTPQGLHNRRIEFLIRYLHDSLPKDISIVYKVNPAQFMHMDHWWLGNRCRLKNIEWFQDVKRLYNFKFVRESYPVSDLIKNSIGVATINGTACFEALAQNKRAISIAPTWLDGVYGVHRVHSCSETKKVIDLMTSNVFDHKKIDFSSVVGNSDSILELKNVNYLNFTLEDYMIINKAFFKAVNVYSELPIEREKV